MLAIASRTTATRGLSSAVAAASQPPGVATPGIRQHTPAAAPASWSGRQTRSVYFDAAHQTALTLKELLRVAPTGSEPLGMRPNSELLRDAMQSLVESVCPRLDDDYESRSFFNQLLSMHLSGLSATELQALSSFLKAAGFSGVASESVWCDAVYEDFGFANGPLGTRQRTLMMPEDWRGLVDQLSEEIADAEKKLIPGSLPNTAEARSTRHLIAYATQAWAASDKSLSMFGEIAQDLCGALGLTFGTRFDPRTVPLLFGIVVIPLTFLGAIYYPWQALAPIRWLQILVLCNPLVYMCEGFRAALTESPHMNLWAVYLVMIGFTALFTWQGIRGFTRRVVS